ncbi:hypothetical protein P8452_69414 [Trifolium repens]|jgi:hypothetical protein|nr:hypothetical protein QL285_042963 [Trifolium repens]WJX87200.1 hypothetical protein P8452_69414 [Trifolium repens]
MEMKNIVFAIVLLAAMINTIMGHGHHHHHASAPAPAPSHETYAPAPTPSHSDAVSLGSFIGSSLLSFVAYYLNFHA